MENENLVEIWCNARKSAVGFYEKLDFVTTMVLERKPGLLVNRKVWRLREMEGT